MSKWREIKPEQTYTEEQINQRLAEELPNWVFENGWIRRKYKTHSWKGTMMVVNTIGHLAEVAWHHPDLTVSYAFVICKLMNHAAKGVTNKDFEGKIYIADFFFTICPSICPILAKNMGAIQKIYKDDDEVLLLSHSVMPLADSVEKIKEYAIEKEAIDNKWHLITGDRDKIYNLARTSYFADEDFKITKDKSEFIHTENFILVDKMGRIRGVYNGTLALDVKRLKRHIEILKNEVI